MMQRPLRLAVWGIGYHAKKNVIPAIHQCDHVELSGLLSRNRSQAAEAASQWGGQIWSSHDEMLSAADVDAVFLCTPPALHYEQGSAVIQSGKHLICEKPMTVDANQAFDLLDQARQREVIVCEALMHRFHPHYRAVLQTVRDSAFGDVRTLECGFGMPMLEQPGFRHTAELGGGAMLDLGCYPVSMAAGLLAGRPEVLSATAEYRGDLAVDMSGQVCLRFPRGEIANLSWGFGQAYRNNLAVWGSNQSLTTDKIFSKTPDYAPTITHLDQRGTPTSRTIAAQNAYAQMMDDVAASRWDPAAREQLATEAWRQAEVFGLVLDACRRALQAGQHRAAPGSSARPRFAHVDVQGALSAGEGVTIDNNVTVKGNVVLGDNVTVEPNSILEDCTIGAGTRIRANTIVEGTKVGEACNVGPYARLRPQTQIGNDAQIGNFVEIKSSQIGDGSKINHHAFVGDALLEADVIIGAGSITCNFDGRTTQPTTIRKGAFVGSGCQLIAPVTIGAGAIVAAGSTVTKDAPPDRLTIARAKQVTARSKGAAFAGDD